MDYFIETRDEESGRTRTHARCKKCGKPIKDLTQANVLGDGGKFVGFYHQSCDAKELADSENLRDWIFRLLWNGGLSDEDYAVWVKEQTDYGS